MKKNLLIYAHYYYPDVASTGQILTELAEGMQESFNITVICTVPSYTGKIEDTYKKQSYYKENINGITVIRVRVPEFSKANKKSRIQNLLVYFFKSIWATCKLDKQDYIFTISQPPILGGVLGVLGKWIKGGKMIYNIQDFNPEQIMAVNYSNNSLLLKGALIIDKLSCRIADKVIVVGRDMQETLNARFSNNKKIPKSSFINNWVDEKKIYPLKDDDSKVLAFKKKYGLENKLVIMYSGNIGLYYNLENIIKVIGKFSNEKDVVFTFIGEGIKKEELEKYVDEHKLTNVIFIPYQDKEELNYSLNAGDIHWVVNAKGIKGVSVPSKLYGVMAAGKTVLGVLEEGSEAYMIIKESQCGVIVEPSDYKALYDQLENIISNPNKYVSMGFSGKKYVDMFIKKDIAIKKYINEILTIK